MKKDKNQFEVEACDEFEKLLPRLSAESYSLLRASIEFVGVREAILVWEDVPGHAFIVDGHNRCRIAEHEGKMSTLRYCPVLSIKSKENAIDWIIANQLMRRNLTDAQRMMFVGMAAARKAAKGKTVSADIPKIRPVGQIDQAAVPVKNPSCGSRDVVAKELGSTPAKVKAALAVQKKLTALDVTEPKVAETIRDDVRSGIIQTARKLKEALKQRTIEVMTVTEPAKKKPTMVEKEYVSIFLGDYKKDFNTIMMLRDRHLGVQADAEALDALIAARILSYWNDRGIKFMAFRNLEATSTKGKK
jgi:hypothetical protein